MPRKNHTRIGQRRPLPPNPCQTKRGFRTEAIARDVAETRMLMAPSIELDVYQCPTCRQWHLTSKK